MVVLSCFACNFVINTNGYIYGVCIDLNIIKSDFTNLHTVFIFPSISIHSKHVRTPLLILSNSFLILDILYIGRYVHLPSPASPLLFSPLLSSPFLTSDSIPSLPPAQVYQQREQV